MKTKVFYCLKVKFLTGKQRQGKGSPSNLAHMAKVSDRMRFKVLTPQKCFKYYQEFLHK